MARPRSDDKRNAIIEATIRVIITQGLSAPTALLAKEAGVSNGTLFIYFKTKADLFNQIYLELKTEMTSILLDGLPTKATPKKQLFKTWTNWMTWAISHPERKRALALLSVSDELTAETRAVGYKKMAPMRDLVELCRVNGAMKDAPLLFVAALMNSIGDTTIDFMIQDSANAEKHCKTGFEALWRAIG